MTNSTQRFSSRVENYIKYRPSYPPAVVDLLARECGRTPASIIADIGSGTGILTELFLKDGNPVFGVEPNDPMREAGERLLAAYPNFTSVNGTAEASTLPDASVDIITAGQAFHWFDQAKAKVEFARIVKPGGWTALIWNERHVDTTPFLVEYEEILALYGTDYELVRAHCGDVDMDAFNAFFGSDAFTVTSFDNRQIFDFEGLRGRVLSSSYTPEPGAPKFDAMMEALAAVFQAHQVDGTVSFEYDTRVYIGRLFV